MKTTKNILIIIIMLFTLVTALLLIMTVFDVTNSEETKRTIVKLTETCGIIAVASAILFGLSSIAKK